MEEKNISFKIDASLYKKLKMHILNKDKKLKEFLIELIEKELLQNEE